MYLPVLVKYSNNTICILSPNKMYPAVCFISKIFHNDNKISCEVYLMYLPVLIGQVSTKQLLYRR